LATGRSDYPNQINNAVGHACILATGRSDYPNQINNAVGFPGVFRGALDVRPRRSPRT
jgi:malate dehydrogenase (oxaloacetate-decarboxylating)